VSSLLGELPLAEISIVHLRQYQQWRRSHGVGARRINHELAALGRVLKAARLWDDFIKPVYKPLPLPREETGMALEPEEAEHLFAISKGNAKWEVAFLAATISANTTAGPGEIRQLRLKDINLGRREIAIRTGAKNAYRSREIDLNDTALRAVLRLMERAQELGSVLPEHYLIPAHNLRRAGYDPTRPVTKWDHAWISLRREAAKKFPRLARLRFYDLRHSCITWLLERNPEHVAYEIAGHCSRAMLERYSHQRREVKRAAVESLAGC
jgi:integrase